MIHAYNELYLNDAQFLLANAFDYAINYCNIKPDLFSIIFSSSKIVQELENGNPAIISGMSAQEFVENILSTVFPELVFPPFQFKEEKNPEYWAGWAIAYYQWFSSKRYKDIFSKIPLSEIISMYKIYHEMDITNFVEDINDKYNSINIETKLKRIREAKGISQSQLALLSGVKKRSIQLYEQKVNDIDKAQAQTLYKLSRVLHCHIEDLLENPEE